MKHPRFLLMAAIFVSLAQIGVLAWMIAGRAAILREGPVIVLAIQPVDPRDFLRGDYVRLNYNISSIDRALFEGEDLEAISPEATIHVQLSEDGDGIWQPVRATSETIAPEDLPEGDVIVRGHLRHMVGEGARAVALNYGIERFYVPEGQGRPIETPEVAARLRMHVAIGPDGAAQIKSLHDGEGMLFSEPLF